MTCKGADMERGDRIRRQMNDNTQGRVPFTPEKAVYGSDHSVDASALIPPHIKAGQLPRSMLNSLRTIAEGERFKGKKTKE